MVTSPSRRLPSSDAATALTIALGIAIVFGYLLIFHLHHEHKDDGDHLGDFPTFYEAATFAIQGKDIYLAGPNPLQRYVYPPLIAFLYTPLTRLSLLAAARVSLLLNTTMLLIAIFVAASSMIQRLGLEQRVPLGVAVLLASILSINELKAQLTMLETDGIMLLMFALSLWWLDRWPIAAGVALGLALNIKYLSIVALPCLILRRRWKATGGMLGGSVFFALLPALLLGSREDLRCLRVSTGGLLQWVGVPPELSHAIRIRTIADDVSVSLTSGLARGLMAHHSSSLQVMLAAAAVGVLSLAIVAALYNWRRLPVLRWPVARRQADQPYLGLLALEWAGLVTVALVFSPDTNSRHLVLAVLVYALAVVLILSPNSPVSRVPAVFGVMLIWLGFTMPFGRSSMALHRFYFVYGIPCCALLIGYGFILWTGLGACAGSEHHSGQVLE